MRETQDLETVKQVLADWPRLIDPQGEDEQADPYVVARALELCEGVQAVYVVTDDTVNRLPIKVSLAKVCDDYGIDWVTLGEFLGPDHLDLPRSWLTPEGRRASPN